MVVWVIVIGFVAAIGTAIYFFYPKKEKDSVEVHNVPLMQEVIVPTNNGVKDPVVLANDGIKEVVVIGSDVVVEPVVAEAIIVSPKIVAQINDTVVSHKIDLSQWKLQLPTASGSGSVTEIKNPALIDYQSEYFLTDTDGAIEMWCPSNGATTTNSSNPRTELREMQPSGNWTFTGTHVLKASCVIEEAPSSLKGIIIGQIHGDDSGHNPQICKLYWKPDNKVIAELKNSDGTYIRLPLGTMEIGDRVEYVITMKDKILTVSLENLTKGTPAVTGTSPFTDSYWDAQKYYFKAGNYFQIRDKTPVTATLVMFDAISLYHA